MSEPPSDDGSATDKSVTDHSEPHDPTADPSIDPSAPARSDDEDHGAGLSRRDERLAVAALTLGAFAMALNANVLGPLQPFVQDDPTYQSLADSDFKRSIGELISVAGVAAALASLLLGPLVDRIGRRPPMLVGAVIFVVGSVAHWFAGGHEALWWARATAGFGGGLVFTGASAAVADLVPYARRGAAMGIFSAGIFLVLPLGLPLAVAAANLGHWRGIFLVQAGLGVLAFAAFARFVPRGIGRSDHSTTQLAVLRQPMVLPGLLSVLLYTGGFFTSIQFVSKWLDESGLLLRSSQVWLWVGLGFNTAVGSLILPRWADRFGKRAFVLLSSAGVAVCMVILARVDSLVGVVAVGVPFTLLAAARTGPLQALLSEIVPSHMRGTLMGVRAAAVNLGIAGCSRIGSGIYAQHGYDALLMAAAGAVTVSYFLVRWFVRER